MGEEKQKQELIDIIKNLSSEKTSAVSIPAAVFGISLSPAEVLVKYLKENENLNYARIARLLNRDQRGIWCTYQRAVKKFSRQLVIPHCEFVIPVSVFCNRQFSILEHLVDYLRKQNVKVVAIAKLVNKSPSTIAAVHHRVRRKLK